MTWNDKHLEKRYHRLLDDAKARGYSDEELAEKYQYLNNPSLKTGSIRIRRMIELAYFLGMLRQTRSIDEGKTPIVLHDGWDELERTYSDYPEYIEMARKEEGVER